MEISEKIRRQYLIITFDKYYNVKKVFGEKSKITIFLPELLEENITLQEINWTNLFIEQPALWRVNAEIIKTIKHNYFLIIYEELEENELWIMTLYDIDDIYNLKMNVENNSHYLDKDFIHVSKKMQPVLNIVQQVAAVDSTVLLLGESGVGKTRFAKMIHNKSQREESPFISVNCGTIPETLIESELFGYVEGAFTGGRSGGQKGVFEEANQGTVFLDEIGELPLNAQVSLLEVLQERKIKKVGSSVQQDVDLRIIAATNKDLKKLVKQKKFREDLFYRLNVVPILIPPLRERMEEIPYLSKYFVKNMNEKYGLDFNLNEDTLESLLQYDWPGNIRELENIIERMVVTNSSEVMSYENRNMEKSVSVKGIPTLKKANELLERELITRAYQKYKTTYRAADALGVHQSTIAKKIKQYNITK